ncbi:hypothetical protein [Streptomyces sp. TLI_146]|uniref:hypothetical protein n=1 Tax=Streptomyces sp. TLI_146 TaxID=1938858 RepID=UPI000C7033F0|nr:hypothetical protein [Streptomyces sp. TLI_146]PKV89219.1 hypothetical protein BX283_6854 [Streptomyces sp. TLI_146]
MDRHPGGPGGRYVLRANGAVAASLDLPVSAGYRRCTLGPVALAPGDRLEIAFESGRGWVDADDAMVSPAAPAPARPRVTSSDPEVAAMFDWGARKANSWVRSPGTVGPRRRRAPDRRHRQRRLLPVLLGRLRPPQRLLLA